MSTQRETGFAAIAMLEAGEYRIPLAAYESVRAAWMRGDAFLEVVDYFGAPMTIKASRIEAVCRYEPAHLAARREHEAAERALDAITGDG